MHFRSLLLYSCALAACSPSLPGVNGADPSSPSPGTRWTPPGQRFGRAPGPVGDSLPSELAARRSQLTEADLVSLALERNPETRESWLLARSSAASYGASRGVLLPTASVDVGLNALQTAATAGRIAVSQRTYGPTLTVSWLLFDFGGRAGAIGAARADVYAANLSHNAVLADVARRTVQAYYAYVGAEGLMQAQRASVDAARANLEAAENRRAVGVTTVVDVLQARTAFAQATLALRDAEGAAATTRGALASLAGLAPYEQFSVDTAMVYAPIGEVSQTVDSLIQRALAERPDLAAARADEEAARQRVRIARSALLPSIDLLGTTGITYRSGVVGGSGSYNVGIGLSIPLFNGFGWQYAARAAELSADALAARTRTLERDASLDVYTTWQELRTATDRVHTADDLLTSAAAAADAARARYREGVGSVLELLSAETALADARAQRVQARVAWHTSLVQLAHDAALLDLDGSARVPLAPAAPTPVSVPGNGGP